ncbi:MAG: hypothetical protein L0G99_09150 [Propionibacteriales bacterium]|nr:hypothetical protein [Propionibacteriales bacterium]
MTATTTIDQIRKALEAADLAQSNLVIAAASVDDVPLAAEEALRYIGEVQIELTRELDRQRYREDQRKHAANMAKQGEDLEKAKAAIPRQAHL